MIDHAPGLELAFAFDAVEDDVEVTAIDGRVPAYLHGDYWLNGPARPRRGELAYKHWLDGDGMVCRLRFGPEGVRCTSRFVQSAKLAREQAAGRAIFRTFGTAFPGDELARGIGLESPVNVSVYPFAGRLLAFGEQGLPWELDRESLATLGPYTFDRKLNAISPFSAHPNFDVHTGEMFNFGVSFSATRPLVNLYRFGPAGELVYRRQLALDGPRSMHDFGLSSNHVVFYLSPYFLAMEGLMEAGSTLLQNLDWQPERGSFLRIARREDGAEIASLAIGQGYCLHLIDCWEDGGRLNVDVLELDQPVYDQYEIPHELFKDVRRAEPVRYVVDLETHQLLERRGLGFKHMADFATIDPRTMMRDYGDFWMLAISATEKPGRKFFDELVHLSWHQNGVRALWRAPEGSYLCGEPLFLPDPASTNGTIVCQRFDAKTRQSSFLLFDAFNLEAGPSAELHLPHPVHLGFHTAWAAAG